MPNGWSFNFQSLLFVFTCFVRYKRFKYAYYNINVYYGKYVILNC